MANTTLRFKDMTFEKVENYDPENTAADKNGIVSYWAAKTPDGEQVVTGENKKKCISAARAYVHEVNEATETAEASEVCLLYTSPASATISAVDWKVVVGTAALAGIASILTSVATGLPEIDETE